VCTMLVMRMLAQRAEQLIWIDMLAEGHCGLRFVPLTKDEIAG
jgi:hypothetical protein